MKLKFMCAVLMTLVCSSLISCESSSSSSSSSSSESTGAVSTTKADVTVTTTDKGNKPSTTTATVTTTAKDYESTPDYTQAGYEYDKLGRLVKVIYDEKNYIEYSYDANGNITKIKKTTDGKTE